MVTELDDYLEPQIGIAVAATAAIASPPVRRVLRRGLVYGLAGTLIAGGALASFGRGVTQGARNVAASASDRIGGEEQPAQ